MFTGTNYGVKECRTVKRKLAAEWWNLRVVNDMKGLRRKLTPDASDAGAAGPRIHMAPADKGVARGSVDPAD